MPKKDSTQIAFDVVQRASGAAEEVPLTPKQARGRKAGLKGGVARANSLTPEERTKAAQVAAQARWKKKS
jgi:hypothetical protein